MASQGVRIFIDSGDGFEFIIEMPKTGLEPTQAYSLLDPESSASTNSATSAFAFNLYGYSVYVKRRI
jgi:hypothetical protein